MPLYMYFIISLLAFVSTAFYSASIEPLSNSIVIARRYIYRAIDADVAPVIPIAAVARAFAEVSISGNVPTVIPNVPFYSQFSDISAPEWRKLSCGIADLAMIINFYKPGAVSADILLQEGIAAGAFIDDAGWSHQGLVNLARAYGLTGSTHDLSNLDMDAAFVELEKFLKNGPVIASVYYTFDPNSPIPHLVVVNGVKDGEVYYNDPAGQGANEKISIVDFMRGWKKRFIVIKP
ncbi:MAG: C39 family peptidase [Patescibacteria group bacterium]